MRQPRFPRYRTQNNALAYASTGMACLDLFSVAGAARRHPAQLVSLFERAYQQEPQLALRVLLWLRDARGGAGERQSFRNLFHWLERRHPKVALALLDSGVLSKLGRWDDLLCVSRPASWVSVIFQVKRALDAGDRLCAKWMPRSGPVAARIYRALGLNQQAWRKRLVALSDTVEQQVCAGHFEAIRYKAVPSVAAARYQRLFRTRDFERYTDFIEAVKAGRACMKAGAVFPHTVLQASRHDDDAATAQWSQLPRPAIAGRVVPVCDVSASMTCPAAGNVTAMEVCIALGLLLAESNGGELQDQVITFSSEPSWHRIQGRTLLERYTSLRNAHWGGSTNLVATFDLLLARAKHNPDFVMPEYLVVFSDMEFNQADYHNDSPLQEIRKRFAATGQSMPHLVFWNLAGRAGNLPAGNEEGVTLVSGFSPSIMAKLFEGNLAALSPEALMREVLAAPRYDVAGVTA